MINGTLLRAARARLARIRRGDDADGGFALAFVLLVTTVITLAVTATLSVVAPNIHNARNDQDTQSALSAAQAGVDDALAWATGHCTTTISQCLGSAQSRGTSTTPIALGTTGQKFYWTATESDDGKSIRVAATGIADSTSKTLSADLGRSRSILSFGYYTDYESQSPAFLYDYYDSRNIYIGSRTAYSQIDTTDVNSPTSVSWNGPPTSGSNPNPASMCGEHWYSETGSPGRASYGSNPAWGEIGKINGKKASRTSSCDVVFTTGMTFDGPVYTRDALLISDKTNGGTGPIFNQPVYSLWGYQSDAASYDNPIAPASAPWRKDSDVGGNLSSASQKPQIAPFDVTLPKDIALDGLPKDACVYTGPTRVKLNGDGTATVTSPTTTSRYSSSDVNCYPTGPLSGGVVNFTFNYKTVGHGAVWVKNLLAGTDPAPTNWPTASAQSTVAATPANSVFYVSSPTGGAATPDQATRSSTPDSGCSTSVTYAAAAFYTCAWTNVAKAGDVGTGAGWSAYNSGTKCNSSSLAQSDREQFECDYSHTTGSTTPSASNRYGTLRSLVQGDLAGGTCASGSTSDLDTCLTAELQSRLQTANSGQHAAGYATPAAGDHQYVVTKVSNGTPSTGAAQSVGSTPTPPMGSDPLFTSTGTPAKEAPTGTPVSLAVSRQTYGCYLPTNASIGNTLRTILSALGLASAPGSYDPTGKECQAQVCTLLLLCAPGPGVSSWGDGGFTTASINKSVPQFSTTVTQSAWSIVSAASGASYFPNTADVTQYNAPNPGAQGTDYPGDLYVEGANSGQLSLLADNDVVVTNDITDTSSDPKVASVDVVAGDNVRNYHPVSCVDTTASDINNTTAGWCPNDITGLYSGASGMESNGVLTSAHPAMQYTNMALPGQSTSCATSDSQAGSREIDAAVFALSGSFLTDNYNRGCQLGPLTVNGGLYQSHRGANGVQWETQSGDTKRATSGYSLQYHYVDLENAELPYTPATGGNGWKVISVSGSGS